MCAFLLFFNTSKVQLGTFKKDALLGKTCHGSRNTKVSKKPSHMSNALHSKQHSKLPETTTKGILIIAPNTPGLFHRNHQPEPRGSLPERKPQDRHQRTASSTPSVTATTQRRPQDGAEGAGIPPRRKHHRFLHPPKNHISFQRGHGQQMNLSASLLSRFHCDER